MSIKIKLFKKLILFSTVLFLQSCSYLTVGYGSIEGTVSFSQKPTSQKKYHIVAVNESLWEISSIYYGNALLWPLLYKLNSDRIYDADLIFPGQNLLIEGKFTGLEKNKAIKHAMSRGIWIIGYQEETDQRFLLD
ncbi:MAG: hypothetical protein VYE60_02420 [Pseudomonadota bacterium]|nr:hypothetical protein [Pseudomonadota bacterium]